MKQKFGGIPAWKIVAAGVVLGVVYYLYKKHSEEEPAEAEQLTGTSGAVGVPEGTSGSAGSSNGTGSTEGLAGLAQLLGFLKENFPPGTEKVETPGAEPASTKQLASAQKQKRKAEAATVKARAAERKAQRAARKAHAHLIKSEHQAKHKPRSTGEAKAPAGTHASSAHPETRKHAAPTKVGGSRISRTERRKGRAL